MRRKAGEKLKNDPASLETSVRAAFESYGVAGEILEVLSKKVAASGDDKMVDFIVRFEHSESPPHSSYKAGFTIGLAYLLGGVLPLLPYVFVPRDRAGLGLSISSVVMVVVLFLFGWWKTGVMIGWGKGCRKRGVVDGLWMVVLGGLAAVVAWVLVKGAGWLAGP